MYKYLLCLFAFCFLCGCYENASNTFIEDNVSTPVADTTEYDRQNIRQNQWTYAEMQEHYLWEEYLPDSTSLNFMNRPQTFFEKLRYKGDRFSWIERNMDYQGGTSLYDRYGLETIEYILPSGGKMHRVALVLPHSPAEAAGLKRDDRFIIANTNNNRMEIVLGTIDGTSFRTEKKVTLLADGKEYTDAVTLDTIYQLQDKKIGYLVYNSFMDGMVDFSFPYRTELRNIFGNFKDRNITDLIIDVRYNRGGYVSIEEIMCSLILPNEYHGKIAGYQSYNKKQAAKRLKETGNEEDILYFPVINGSNVGMRKVYIIITGRSASASESLINSLEPCISVFTVGSTSLGKNVGSYQLKDNRYEWQLQPITFYYYNLEHKAVPETGIVPDIQVDERNIDVWYELGDTREKLLSVVLEQITGETTLRSAIDYGKFLLTPAKDDGQQRRKVEGMVN